MRADVPADDLADGREDVPAGGRVRVPRHRQDGRADGPVDGLQDDPADGRGRGAQVRRRRRHHRALLSMLLNALRDR